MSGRFRDLLIALAMFACFMGALVAVRNHWWREFHRRRRAGRIKGRSAAFINGRRYNLKRSFPARIDIGDPWSARLHFASLEPRHWDQLLEARRDIVEVGIMTNGMLWTGRANIKKLSDGYDQVAELDGVGGLRRQGLLGP